MRKRDVGGRGVLFKIASAFRSGNWNDVLPLGQHPGECELRGRHTFFAGDLLDLLYEPDILFEVLSLKPRAHSAIVVLSEVLKFLYRPRKESPTERRISHESEAELAACREDVILLNVTGSQAVFAL